MANYRQIITTYIVTKKGSGARITFGYMPNLATDLPLDFADPGETVIVSRQIIAREEVIELRAIRLSDGYQVTQGGKTYTIEFLDEDDQANIQADDID